MDASPFVGSVGTVRVSGDSNRTKQTGANQDVTPGLRRPPQPAVLPPEHVSSCDCNKFCSSERDRFRLKRESRSQNKNLEEVPGVSSHSTQEDLL